MNDLKITHYCLGNGNAGCDGCKKEKNWQLLNEMPDSWRQNYQNKLERISDDLCILNGRKYYEK